MTQFFTWPVQIAALRGLRRMTSAAIAERLNLGREQVSRWCSGTRDARMSSMQAVATALDAEWVLVPKEAASLVQTALKQAGLVGPGGEQGQIHEELGR